MKQLKSFIMIGILFVLITGTLAHFVYGWTGNNRIVGLFTPINESVWEHMKLLFFPMLLYALTAGLSLKKQYTCITSSLCFGILIGTICIPVLFYAYTYILGKNFLVIDIGTFVLSTILAFYAVYQFTQSCKLKPYSYLLYGFVVILCLCFLLFTYRPLPLTIFVDPSAAR